MYKPCDRCGVHISLEQAFMVKFDLKERTVCDSCGSYLKGWLGHLKGGAEAEPKARRLDLDAAQLTALRDTSAKLKVMMVTRRIPFIPLLGDQKVGKLYGFPVWKTKNNVLYITYRGAKYVVDVLVNVP